MGTCPPIMPVTWLRDGLVWVLSLMFIWCSILMRSGLQYYHYHDFLRMICYLQCTSLNCGLLWKGNSANPQRRLISRLFNAWRSDLAQPPFPNLSSPLSLYLTLCTHKSFRSETSVEPCCQGDLGGNCFPSWLYQSLKERLCDSCHAPLAPSLSLERSKAFPLLQLRYGFAWPEPNTWQFSHWFCYHPLWLWALL